MKKITLILVFLFIFYSCKSTPERVEEVDAEFDLLSVIEDDLIEGDLVEDEFEDDIFDEIPDKIAEEEFLEEEIEPDLEELVEEDTEESEDELAETESEELEEDNILEEKIDNLHQLVLELQEQLAQLMERPPAVQEPPVPQPAPIPPPVVQVPQMPQEPIQEPEEEPEEEPEQAIAETPPPTERPPVSVREVLPVPTPSQSMIVPADRNNEIIFSRVVRATVGQIIEIPFRGTGWVYLGELASRRGIAYDSRRNDPDGFTFIFRAEEAGTYALKFSRHDFIRDYILNDHVQIIVGEAPTASTGWFNPPSDRERIVAQPRWPSASEEAEILRGGARSAPVLSSVSPVSNIPQEEPVNVQDVTLITEPPNNLEVAQGTETASVSSPDLPVFVPPSTTLAPNAETEQRTEQSAQTQPVETIPLDQLISRAKEMFDAGNVAEAIALLDQYSARFPSGTDELYWLYGQFYEANTPSRNILLSLDYYKRLTNEFPQSTRFNDARRRIAYLERFYINIQ